MSGKLKIVRVLPNPRKKRKKAKAKRRSMPRRRYPKKRTASKPFVIELCQVRRGPGTRQNVDFFYWTGTKNSANAGQAKSYPTEAAANRDAFKAMAKMPTCHGARIVRL